MFADLLLPGLHGSGSIICWFVELPSTKAQLTCRQQPHGCIGHGKVMEFLDF